jgi:hypothetical protein
MSEHLQDESDVGAVFEHESFQRVPEEMTGPALAGFAVLRKRPHRGAKLAGPNGTGLWAAFTEAANALYLPALAVRMKRTTSFVLNAPRWPQPG